VTCCVEITQNNNNITNPSDRTVVVSKQNGEHVIIKMKI